MLGRNGRIDPQLSGKAVGGERQQRSVVLGRPAAGVENLD
jgi:hypothetical protein